MRDYLYNLATDRSRGAFSAAAKFFLFLLSLLYGLSVRLARFFARLRIRRLNCRVISVGNITLGGTGKTTLVEFIARYLKENGRRPAILSRGYKRKLTQNLARQAIYENMGDEPFMLKAHLGLPVLVGANRLRLGNAAIRDFAADTVILDDGFQQWKLRKDLEVVTVDCANPFGNRCLLPRGILREPVSSLRRADIIVLTKVNLKAAIPALEDYLRKINPAALIAEAAYEPIGFYALGENEERLGKDSLRGEAVTLICGIGDPDSFRDLILSLGIKIGLSFVFGDHYHYLPQDIERAMAASRQKDIHTLMTTEKDAVRISRLKLVPRGLRILALRIEARITRNEEEFRHRLLRLYHP